MNDERLKGLLERAGDSGRGQSQARAWEVVEAAYRARAAEADRGRPRFLVAAVATGLAALLVALAFTPPGSAVADWVRDRVAGRPGAKKSAPALTHLPGGGRLLVRSAAGVWVVSADGSRRLLGDYAGATWSPRGLFVAVWRGSELLAVEPGGRVRWSLARQGRVRAARWSPDGFRVAYLAGAQLRVVAGDGTGDRGFRRNVAAVAPAWRPNAPHLLAYAAGGRSVELVSTDLGARAWRSRLPATPRLLEWSPDGTVLAAADRTGVTLVHGTSGRVARRIHAAPGFAVTAIAFSPDGKRLAVAASSRNGTARLFTAGLGRGVPQRRLFAGSGTFSQAEWSPDGRWVMIAWPEADQWLFVRSSGQPGVSAVRGIARQFDPGRPSPAFPRLGDWCCA